MARLLLPILLVALALQFTVLPAEAGLFRFRKCECTGHYEPPRGVFKLFTRRIDKRWEHRHHCLPGGRKIPYKVQVITYRERYSDGSTRTWKCVVRGSQVTLGK